MERYYKKFEMDFVPTIFSANSVTANIKATVSHLVASTSSDFMATPFGTFPVRSWEEISSIAAFNCSILLDSTFLVFCKSSKNKL